MASEIERKFLLKSNLWQSYINETLIIRQGYLATTDKASTRIRRQDGIANINIKAAVAGIEREEFEYIIPANEADYMLENLCLQPIIDKKRHLVSHEGHLWEIDEFSGENEGLIIAEIELISADEDFALPEWLGKEVTDQIKYYNSSLRVSPYKSWHKK